MSKISKEALVIAAASLTVAEAILGTPGPSTDYTAAVDPPGTAYAAFKAHLERLKEDDL